MSTDKLLIEIGCEELPAGQLDSQLKLFSDDLAAQLLKAGLVQGIPSIERFASPRRLALRVAGVRARQADQIIERSGPNEAVALDSAGQPTRAGEGFARSVGKPFEALEWIDTDQGRRLFCRVEQPGQTLDALLPDMFATCVTSMAGARSMRWSDREERFLRPVRWLLALHGERVIPLEHFGLRADRTTRGHRIHTPGWHRISRADDYETVLESVQVLVDPARRGEQVTTQAQALATSAGLEPVLNPELVEEVAGLTEWPQAVLGRFDSSFLDLPEEVLIASLEQHQKCFALRDSSGQLAARFIAVANIESADPELMCAGFERVIRPRLADARFFRDQDRRSSLASKRERLDSILFQKQLGSLGDKVRRLEELVKSTAAATGADIDSAVRAATLCKCDLVTEMVGEFPELQGVIGRYYALDDGENPAVCTAIESHYLPRHGGDQLPAEPVGQALGLADRLDTLLGIFAAGQKPRGGKDPFALRRAALGVVRILADCGTATRLDQLLQAAAAAYGEQSGIAKAVNPELVEEVHRFCRERLKPWAAELDIETNTVHAVAAVHRGSIADFLARIRAVQHFADDPAMASLVAANKRASNLLKQTEDQQIGEVDRKLLQDEAESALFTSIQHTASALDEALEDSDYPRALSALARLGDPLDAFFEQVMVLADDASLRNNRLALLNTVRGLFLRIADLARLGR